MQAWLSPHRMQTACSGMCIGIRWHVRIAIGRSVPPSLMTRWGWSIGTRSGSTTSCGRQILRIPPPPAPVTGGDRPGLQGRPGGRNMADGPRERDAALCTQPGGGGAAARGPRHGDGESRHVAPCPTTRASSCSAPQARPLPADARDCVKSRFFGNAV